MPNRKRRSRSWPPISCSFFSTVAYQIVLLFCIGPDDSFSFIPTGVSASSFPNHANSEVKVGFWGICLSLSVVSLQPSWIPERKIIILSKCQFPTSKSIRWCGENREDFPSANLGSDTGSKIYQVMSLWGQNFSSTLICEVEVIITTSKGCCEDQVRSLACRRCSRDKNTKLQSENHHQTTWYLCPPPPPVPGGSYKTFLSSSSSSESFFCYKVTGEVLDQGTAGGSSVCYSETQTHTLKKMSSFNKSNSRQTDLVWILTPLHTSLGKWADISSLSFYVILNCNTGRRVVLP